jgi:hypothetical protein
MREDSSGRTPLAHDVVELHAIQIAANDDHEVDSWRPDVGSLAERFTNEPFAPIPYDGSAHFA